MAADTKGSSSRRGDRSEGREQLMREPSHWLIGENGSGEPGEDWSGLDVWPVRGTRELYTQAEATRMRSVLLGEQLRAAKREVSENWRLIRDAWDRTEQIRAQRQAARTDPDRLRYSAYARLRARLASMPVIEQAKGIIMARYGWTEDQAFEALCRVSQQENIKVRDLAMSIVAGTTHAARAQPARADRAG